MSRLLICTVGSIRPNWTTALESLRTIVDSFDEVDIQIIVNDQAEIYPPWVLAPGWNISPDDYRFNRTFSPDIREKCKQINNFIATNKIFIPNCMKKSINILIDREYIYNTIEASHLNFKNININIVNDQNKSNLLSMINKFSLVEIPDNYDLVLRIRPDYIYTIPKFQLNSYTNKEGVCVDYLSYGGDKYNKDLSLNWAGDGVAIGPPDMMKLYFQLSTHINNKKGIPHHCIHYFLYDYCLSKSIQLYTSENLKIKATNFYIDQHYIDTLLPIFLGKFYNIIKSSRSL
jgi:hypothetical protein